MTSEGPVPGKYDFAPKALHELGAGKKRPEHTTIRIFCWEPKKRGGGCKKGRIVERIRGETERFHILVRRAKQRVRELNDSRHKEGAY